MLRLCVGLVACLLVVVVVVVQGKHQLIEVHPVDQKQVKQVEDFKAKEHMDIKALSDRDLEAVLTGEESDKLKRMLREIGVDFEVASEDMERDIKIEDEEYKNHDFKYDYSLFNELNNINKELERLASKCIPGFVCLLDSLGRTFEKRPVNRIKITKEGVKRKAMWIDATTHAREWISTTTAMNLLRHMIEDYDSDQDVKHLVDTYDWFFVPVVNPDGYAHTWIVPESFSYGGFEGRLWRKNRRINKGSECIGVDLARNNDNFWARRNPDPCSEEYEGPYAASEPENRAIQKELMRISPHLLQLLTLHSYGMMWLIPYGHKNPTTNQCYVSPDNFNKMKVANAAADAMGEVYQTKWVRGPVCSTVYPAAGTIMDYAYLNAGADYASVIELRGDYFVVSREEIPKAFEEMWAGLVTSIRTIEEIEKEWLKHA